MRLKKLYKLTFAKGNVCVVGLRGNGKDMLFANITDRATNAYISNVDYSNHSKYYRFSPNALRVGNDYRSFLNGDIKPFAYPYPQMVDFYLSDCGVYFPSQYCSELNRDYKDIPTFMALSRHIADCNVHFNVQNLNRVWDKIREQSDTFISCESCTVLFGKLVVQRVIVYDRADSCQNRVKPFIPLKPPLMSHGANRGQFTVKNEELLRSFKERNGSVKAYTLIYFNRSKYDTHAFRDILKIEHYEQNQTKKDKKQLKTADKIKTFISRARARLERVYRRAVDRLKKGDNG